MVSKINWCLSRLLLIPILAWTKVFSPFFGNHCRFYPSCSCYMVEAIDRFGIFKGLFLGVKRIARCNSLFPGGEDPLPAKPLKHTASHVLPQSFQQRVREG